MSRKFKSLICLFIFLITLSPINVKATETKNIKDYLNYLSEPEVQQLQGSIDEIANKYNLDTVIVITDNTEGKTSMEYADDFYDYKHFRPIMNIDIFHEYNKVYIAKIPTIKPYEVFAYIPIGGFNDCPRDEEHIAIAKYWYEKHGIFPIAIGCDTVQYSVKNLTKDGKKFDDLCIELVFYCEDIIIQGYETLKALKDVLKRSTIVLFWWD